MILNPLFINKFTTENNQENDIETKFQNRQEFFTKEDNFSSYKENAMINELSLGKNKKRYNIYAKKIEKGFKYRTNSNFEIKTDNTIGII